MRTTSGSIKSTYRYIIYELVRILLYALSCCSNTTRYLPQTCYFYCVCTFLYTIYMLYVCVCLCVCIYFIIGIYTSPRRAVIYCAILLILLLYFIRGNCKCAYTLQVGYIMYNILSVSTVQDAADGFQFESGLAVYV